MSNNNIDGGATKTRLRMGLAGIGPAFGTIGSRVTGFDVIAIIDIICFLPLTINDSHSREI